MPSRRHWREILVVICGLLLSVAGAAAASEGPLSWQALGGPGGRISHLAVASATELYAVSVGGVNRRDDQTQWRNAGNIYWSHALYRSVDGGKTWQPLTNDLPPGSISALYVDQADGTLYAGIQGRGDDFTRRYGLWRSADRGRSWEQIPLGRDDLIIRRIGRDADGRALYLGAISAVKYASSYVLRSTDDGETWTQVEALRYEQRPGSTLVDLVLHPKDPNLLFITTYGGEVYRSADAGATWIAPELPEGAPPAAQPGPVRLAISPDPPETLLAARGRGGPQPADLTVERSTDGGITWTRLPGIGLPAKGGTSTFTALPGDVFLLGTEAGAYRSADRGETWQRLEGPLNSGEVAEFVLLPGSRTELLAAAGYGIFASRDAGALWQPPGNLSVGAGVGLPFNSRIIGLLTDPRQPERIYAISGLELFWEQAAPPLILRSLDGGRTWAPAAAGLPKAAATAWTLDPSDPNVLYLASADQLFRTSDGGLTWQGISGGHGGVTFTQVYVVAVAPSNPNTIYLGGWPVRLSTDRGATWQEVPVRPAGGDRQTAAATGLAIDPTDARHVWAGLDGGGMFESTDGGATWRESGLAGRRVGWLAGARLPFDRLRAGSLGVDQAEGLTLYAGLTEDGIYRSTAEDRAAATTADEAWKPAAEGLPEHSTVLALAVDPRTPGTLWAARDGGGFYRSTDGGENWANMGTSVGDNLALAIAPDYATPGGVLIGTATAGVWTLRPNAVPSAAPRAVDARIEILWPHDWAPVSKASLANLGLRLFAPASLQPSPCGWTPEVRVWQAVDNEPAMPLETATQRSVDGQPFPFWELNDIDVRLANDPKHRLYFMVQVVGVETATSIWAHGADARTFFPQQDVPSGSATGPIDAVDTRIQIVWPHDAAGQVRPVSEGTYVNIAVLLFQHGTRLSVPVEWQPAGLTLYGAWNQEIGRPLAREATIQVRQSGVITYPVWEFNNIPVSRAVDPTHLPTGDPFDRLRAGSSTGSPQSARDFAGQALRPQGAFGSRLHLWVIVDGVETYPTIWTHGTDARTFFPTEDEPIQGCVP